MDTRVTGEGYPEEQTGNGAVPTRLSRHPPDLTPLPVSPTAIDVAVRYGQFAAFLMQQWPVLYDVVTRVDGRISALERRNRAHWVMPMLLGVFGVLALVEGLLLAIRWH